MSTQSIKEIDICNTYEEIDHFLICEGNYFRNIIDFDLDGKPDYDKINMILWLKDMLKRTDKCETVLLLIDKILRK